MYIPVRRRHKPRQAALLAAAGMLVACGQTGPQRDAEEVSAASKVARQRQEAVLDRLRLPGQVVQRESADACAGGQSNLTVRDDFEYFCTFGTAQFVAIRTEDPARAFVEADRALLAAAQSATGCRPDELEATPALALGVSERMPGAVGSVFHECGGLVTEVSVLRADDTTALASNFRARPTVPTGTVFKTGRLDIEAVPAQAARSGAGFLILVQVAEQYLIKPR